MAPFAFSRNIQRRRPTLQASCEYACACRGELLRFRLQTLLRLLQLAHLYQGFSHFWQNRPSVDIAVWLCWSGPLAESSTRHERTGRNLWGHGEHGLRGSDLSPPSLEGLCIFEGHGGRQGEPGQAQESWQGEEEERWRARQGGQDWHPVQWHCQERFKSEHLLWVQSEVVSGEGSEMPSGPTCLLEEGMLW